MTVERFLPPLLTNASALNAALTLGCRVKMDAYNVERFPMKRRADGFLITENAHSTRPADASLFDAKARRLREEKIVFVCLDSRATKSLNHSNPVTAVTDSDNLTLVMCGYSGNSIFEFAAGSSSGEIQVDSRPSLNRANFPGRSPEFKRFSTAGTKRQPPKCPIAIKGTNTFGLYLVQLTQRPNSQNSTT
jgi:hypothetical protein